MDGTTTAVGIALLAGVPVTLAFLVAETTRLFRRERRHDIACAAVPVGLVALA